jgi:hypothetical protein
MDPVFDERDGNFLVRCRNGGAYAQRYDASRWSPPPPPPPAETWQPSAIPADTGGPSAAAGVSGGNTLSYPLLGAGTGGVDLGY